MKFSTHPLFGLALASFLALTAPQAAVSQTAPYPPSPVISGVSWETSNIATAAPGSDLWPLAWAADGNLYTGWGDGGGFGGTNSLGRVKLGVARISGPATSFSGTNIFGGHNGQVAANFVGKPTGMLAVGGALYMAVVEQDAWLRLKITRSNDNGRTWDFNSRGWDFAESDGAFSDLTFLTFGQNYAGARDGYVYAYSQDKRVQSVRTEVAMFRVPTGQIQNRSAYEYFAGLNGSGNPIWTTNINQRQPVFRDPVEVGWGVAVVYNPGLDRYLLTTWHNQNGGWGIFDAPEPWGPWTTVAYYNNWLDNQFKFAFTFNQKWMSADGKTAHMVFSGTGSWDEFAVIKATFTLAGGPDTSPPTVPGGLSTSVQSQTRINLSWNAASDPESGVSNYNVYRDGVRVATPGGTSYADQNLSPGTTYSYRVSATNGAGIEGAQSGAKTATTQSPPPPPPPPPPAPDTTAPTVPGGLSASVQSQTRINLSWNAASDPESGVSNYNVYRDGVRVATPGGTSYADQNLSPGTTYSYRVSATNGAGIEGAKGGAKTATTQSPPPPPPPPPPPSGGDTTTPSPQPPSATSGTVAITNLSAQSGTNYTVQPGLSVGSKQYIDRIFTFQQVPGVVTNASFIQTANDDKNALPGNTDFLSFDVDRDVIVYVAHDDRLQRPAWLTSGFVDSGLDLSSGGGTYSLFSRSFAAGSVQLGSNIVQPTSSSMYSVIVTTANQSDTTAPAAPTGLRVIAN